MNKSYDTTRRSRHCVFVVTVIAISELVFAPAQESRGEQATIRRDKWGVAHIHGTTHADAFFGMGYAQAEDYFWQLEDTCIRSLGRYAEVVGEEGLSSDILNRSFEVVPRSKQDFDRLKPEYQRMAAAYAQGINRYLETHPDENPRLIDHFEPWYAVAMDRHMILDFAYRQAHVGKPGKRGGGSIATLLQAEQWNAWDFPQLPSTGFEHEVREAIGSNAWAVSGKRTRSGKAMLFINPHQPWYGMGQFYEAHIQSDQGLNFSGACFFGNPFPTIGHNEHLGWTYTVNSPDIADAWRITFDDPGNPLNYRYNGSYRTAEQWTETLRVRNGKATTQQQVTFRKTHHGPIVRRDGDSTFLAVQVSGLFDMNRVDQAWDMVRADTFGQWKTAMSHCAIPMFNVVYADDQNNIFYCYNGSIPVRDSSFNWKKPVDGSDPKTEWNGTHRFDELPQVLNPESGYVQSCNSTPYTTTDNKADNPERKDFPSYMIEDADVDMRRSKMSRMILRNSESLSFDDLRKLAYDTRLYWAMTEIPALKEDFQKLKKADPALADEISDYFKHLTDWDFCSSVQSTQTTLVVAWYEELYGFGYPAETLKPQYAKDRLSWFKALKKAGAKITGLYGTWKHPWGEAHRLQRIVNQSEVNKAGVLLNPLFNSLPCPGTPGPLGIIFTVYSSPEIQFIRPQRFAVVGASYMAVVEFDRNVRTESVMPFGASGRGDSPHFFDQAALYSAKKFKPAWFTKKDILLNTKTTLRLNP